MLHLQLKEKSYTACVTWSEYAPILKELIPRPED